MKNPEIEHDFYKQLQRDIDRIDSKSDKYRNIYYLLRVLLIGLAFIITVLSGWNGKEGEDILNCVLIFGALTTVITAIDTLFQTETKKNTYRLMLVELREIRSELVFYHMHQDSDLDIIVKDKLFPKYQAIMAYSKSLIEQENEDSQKP